MRWTERQRAMLGEMGLRLWLPQDDPLPETASAETGVAQSAAVLSAPAPAVAPAASPGPNLRDAGANPPAARLRGSVGAATPALPREPTVIALQSSADVATMDWPTLRETVACCTACALSQGRRQTVFGVGNERAHWMIVGEAPGEQEDLQGEPFVGKSGQLLDNMLRAIGLSRNENAPGTGTTTAAVDSAARQVYIANTVKCRPPGNRNPARIELAQCEAYLIRQVQLVQPKIILAMGRFAVQSLLRSDEPIGKLRGRVHHYQGVPLIVTYHPAYLLRNLEDKAKAWDDLCLAVETMRAAQAAGAAHA